MAQETINTTTIWGTAVGKFNAMFTELYDMFQVKHGWFDYNDNATTGTPIAHAGTGGFIQLTNDILGSFTNTTYGPTGVSRVWNESTDQFDFTELSLGDMVDIRFDVDVTTSGPNQEIDLRLQLGIGGSPYNLELIDVVEKTAGVHRITIYMGIYMGDANTLNNPAEVQFDSDDSADITVRGWYCKITRR